MTILPYRDRSFARFLSSRTGETLFEITMLDGAIIVWGAHYRPNEFWALLEDDAATVRLLGRLYDRCGPGRDVRPALRNRRGVPRADR